MDASQAFFVQSLIRRFEGDCRSAQSRIAQLKTIPDVVRGSHVVARPLIRSMTRGLPSLTALRRTAVHRIEQLVADQIKVVGSEPDTEKQKEMLGRLRLREWDALRGEFAMQWRFADSQAQRLLHKR